MTKHIFTFLGTFVAGAVIALIVRAALFKPHADAAIAAPPTAIATHASAPKSVVTTETAAHSKPVNTVCAICGMDVDPTLPTATYKGQTIGFGCRMCPPKFQAAPDKYGPAYLRNEVLEK